MVCVATERKGQLETAGTMAPPPAEQFYALAA